jgi:large subunit ribosomal protein L40
VLSDEEFDHRAVVAKAYCKSRAHLAIADDAWIRQMFHEQNEALKVLKEVSPSLYEAAVQPDCSFLPLSFQGPMLTAPLRDYHAPDGDYVDTTPTYT